MNGAEAGLHDVEAISIPIHALWDPGCPKASINIKMYTKVLTKAKHPRLLLLCKLLVPASHDGSTFS